MPRSALSIPAASPVTTRITGVAAIVAPLLMLASTVAYVTDGGGINDGLVGGTIGVWSCLAFLLAFAGIYRVLEPHALRAAPILMSVMLIGCAGGIAFNIDGVLSATFGREAIDAATGEQPFSILAYLPWGLFFPAGLIGTGALMWRTRVVAPLSALLVAAGGLLFVSSRPARVDALAVFADVVVALALVPIGWSLLRGVRHTGATRAEPRVPAAA